MLTRRSLTLQFRREAAELSDQSYPQQIANGEELDYRDNDGLTFVANHTKGLPHDPDGEVEPGAYEALLRALASGDPADFESLPMGANVAVRRRMVNPQAGLGLDPEGPDSHALTIPPAPRIDGPEAAAEMAELYWMALLRDTAFRDFDTDAIANEAATSLTGFSTFTGPRDQSGTVTPQTLFRGLTPGDLVGPYVSQFLLKDVQLGTLRFRQRQHTAVADTDYMQSFTTWLNVQNGVDPATAGIIDVFDPLPRYIRTPRDLATYVHFDALYQAYLNACLILLDLLGSTVLAPPLRFDVRNPYELSETQQGFATFGGPHVLSLVTEVATRALKAVWYQKWFVHRRLRPEAFGALIHRNATGVAGYPIHPEIGSKTGSGEILDRINDFNMAATGNMTDSYLLPQAFPEGSPMHPSYGAGHATVAGACVTVLKAFFDESYPLPDPVVASVDGRTLEPYAGGETLTVGGELNKLAANISIGRNMAGVHWRTDYTASVRLGEAVAIGIMREQQLGHHEQFGGLSLTTFDGQAVTI